jgi:hypothetical protein
LIKVADGYIGGTVWLKRWSEVNGETGRNPQIGKYIGIYFAFGFGSSALVIIQTLILWIFCSIEVRVCFMVVQTFSSCSASSGQVQHEANAKLRLYLGFSQVARKNGICHISLTNEFLRDHSSRSHPEPFLKASWRISRFYPVAQNGERLINHFVSH